MLSLCPQSQAVSDGGKSEKASFFLKEVCVSEYIRVSLSLRCSSLPLGLQSWTCLQELPVEATTPVFQALRVERRAPPTESWAGLSHSKVCWRIPAASIILLWAVYSRCCCFLGSQVCTCVHTVSLSVGLLEIWGERREHFILASLWEVQEDPCCLCGWGEMAHLYVSLCMILEPLNSSTSLNGIMKEST